VFFQLLKVMMAPAEYKAMMAQDKKKVQAWKLTKEQGESCADGGDTCMAEPGAEYGSGEQRGAAGAQAGGGADTAGATQQGNRTKKRKKRGGKRRRDGGKDSATGTMQAHGGGFGDMLSAYRSAR
jgi:hypothetical protein